MDAEWIETVDDATRGRNYHAEHVEEIARLKSKLAMAIGALAIMKTDGDHTDEEIDAVISYLEADA